MPAGRFTVMQKNCIKRFYYRNGRVHVESRQVGMHLHGLNRTWHFNGQLAEELRYRRGQMHGTSRQWDEAGHLLGSFTMEDGTGVQRYWHDTGHLRLEIASVAGKFHGRTRIWLRDGTLISEKFYLGFMDATRAAYLKAARTNLDWPQYAGDPASKVARPGAALERRKFELFIESILAKSHAEARQWLRGEKNPRLRSLATFRTAKAALRFVETLYAAGAEKVVVAPIYAGKGKKLFADWLLIQLPKNASKRRELQTLCKKLCDRRDGAMLPDPDTGESHLFVRLE